MLFHRLDRCDMQAVIPLKGHSIFRRELVNPFSIGTAFPDEVNTLESKPAKAGIPSRVSQENLTCR